MSQVVGKNKTQKSWSWTATKNQLRKRARIVDITEKDIWWCAVGENIGVEINGKNNRFERPVLVYKKMSKLGFIGIPLTSQKKNGSWYTYFRHHNKDQYAALTQIRFFSIHRVYRRMGQIDDSDYDKISIGLHGILFPNDTINTSNLAAGVCGRENPEYDSIIPNHPNLVKRLFQKIFRKTDRKNRKESQKENHEENQASKGANK